MGFEKRRPRAGKDRQDEHPFDSKDEYAFDVVGPQPDSSRSYISDHERRQVLANLAHAGIEIAAPKRHNEDSR